MTKHRLIVEEAFEGRRIDVFMAEMLPEHSRSYYQKLLGEGHVFIGEKACKANHKLKKGEEILVELPEPAPLEIPAENIPLDVVYEDEHLIVVNKPQGMVVHPAHGNYSGTLVNALLFHCGTLSTLNEIPFEEEGGSASEAEGESEEGSKGGFSGINGVLRPGIVHRIDKDTSGILVVAKSNEAHLKLSEQLKAHTMTRVYLALVEGRVKDEAGRIETMIGRCPKDRKKMAVVTRGGKKAVTHYKVVQRFQRNTLIEARLETGRTHQIRVHMAHIGHPLVGDSVYGYLKQKNQFKGQLLHAKVLGFKHPISDEYMEFEAPLPEYFRKALEGLH